MGSKWRWPVAYVLGLYAAAVLVVAAFFKAGDPGLFIDQITAHQITPPSWSPVLAYFFVAVEFLAAAAFIAFVWPRLVFSGTILLMLGFIGTTACAWAMGYAEDCGCFGRLVERGPQEVIIEDAAVAIACALGLALTRGYRARRWQWAVAAPLVVLSVVLTIFGAALPIDGFIVGLGPGSDLSDIALQGVREPVDEGLVLLAIVGPECPECDAGVEVLKAVVSEKTGPRVVAAYPGTRGEAQTWRMKHLPNFPIANSAPRALRQYYRRLPAVFLLRDGVIQHVWWGSVPRLDQVAHACS